MGIYKQYNNLSVPVKASLWFIACFVIQRGLQFIGMPIFTRIMSQEDYGVYSVFFSWTNILCVISSLNIYSGVFNKAAVKYEDERDEYISSVQFLTLFVGLLMSIVILGFNKQIEEWTGFSIKLQLLMCVHILLFPSFQYWAQKQRFLFEYKNLVIVTLLNSVLSLLLGVLFVLIAEDKSLALITVTVGIQTIINLFIFISLLRKGHCFYRKDFWAWSIISAIPLIPHYLSEILLGHADRIMINQMCGPAQAGIYNIIYQLSMIMTIIRTGINGSYTPWVYLSLKAGKYDSIRRNTSLIVILMALMTLILILIGPEILKMAAPPSYYESIIDMPAIMLGCFFIFVYVLFINIEIYYEQHQFVAIASIIAAVLSIGANVVFIPIYGYLSCGYTTMFSYMLMAILHYIFYVRICKKNPDACKIFNLKTLFCVSLVLTLCGIGSLFVYKSNILRWFFILLLFMSIYVERRKILTALKEIRQH